MTSMPEITIPKVNVPEADMPEISEREVLNIASKLALADNYAAYRDRAIELARGLSTLASYGLIKSTSRRHARITPEMREQMETMLAQGVSQRTVAKTVGVSLASVARHVWLKRQGNRRKRG
jgi:DNA invertase Pin-like site-specific DNA recombinase